MTTLDSAALALPSPAQLAQLEELVDQANEFAKKARSSSTRTKYARDFEAFRVWCAAHALASLPATPATVAIYLAALAGDGLKPATIDRKLVAIGHAHRHAGHRWQHEEVIATVRTGIRRDRGVAPVQKSPILDDDLARMLAMLGAGPADLRDRALLTMGWLGAFRRGELVALAVEDIERQPKGFLVKVRRSKMDQEGVGDAKGVPYAMNAALCPVLALDAWLAASGITTGALFRGVDRFGRVMPAALCDRSVALIVQRTAARAGLDPARFAGHSLRAGFATTAAKKGKSLDAIMRQTLHKSERVARTYIRHAGVFDDNAAIGIA